MTRIVMIRVPAAAELLHSTSAYLPKEGSFAQDLVSLGLPVSSPQIDEKLREFLCFGDGQGLDQPRATLYRAIVELFDREWLGHLNEALHLMP